MTSSNDPIHQLFDALWQDYVTRLSLSAPKIHQLISQHDSETRIQNDHIALRTFSGKKLGLAQLAQHFEALGYVKGGDYDFKAKKLVAHHYQHADLTYPKVFISELVVEQCSVEIQTIIQQLLAQTSDDYAIGSRFLFSGRPWSLSYQDYLTLAKESEYAAWVAAHGFGANHFTVDVNALNQFTDVADVNRFLKQNGFTLNQGGGEVKGTIEDRLEQSATLADEVSVNFSDGEHHVPGGFYEFAKRYRLDLDNKTSELYQGFVTASADKIFESTDLK